jgi:two-component system CheB/CheR fusion protein
MAEDALDRDAHFENLLDFIKWNRGFDFTGYKRASLMRRVERRMQTVDVRGYESYRDYLAEHPAEFGELFNTILINVTSFFRDPPMWEYLAGEIVPRLVDASEATGSLRVWTPGCSTGEEAYTAAILLAEALDDHAFRTRVKIYATDADEEALAVGRQGGYAGASVANVPEALREKYFDQAGERHVLRPEIRRAVIFGRHDLIQDPPISKVDLLTARNTLMYFEPEAQTQVLASFHFALRDTGYLFLGKSEVLMTRTKLFVPVDLKRRVFARLPRVDRRDRPLRAPVTVAAPQTDAGAFATAAFESAPVPQIVIDADGRLALANLHSRMLFGLNPRDVGRPFQDLELSYRPADLRSAMDGVRERREAVRLRDVEWWDAGGDRHVVDVQVAPVAAPAGPVGAISITFTETTRYAVLQESVDASRQAGETAYEELQATFEELETTNEELQSTNEELETTNEELQAANEELETMNEELQATNEELEAINDLLTERTGELNTATAFLGAILGSLDAGVVVLDPEQRVTAWNRGAEELWGVRADEVTGRHFLTLDIGLPVDELRHAIRATLGGGSIEELVVTATNRRGRAIECAITLTPLEPPARDGDAATNGGGGVQGAIVFMEPREPRTPA